MDLSSPMTMATSMNPTPRQPKPENLKTKLEIPREDGHLGLEVSEATGIL